MSYSEADLMACAAARQIRDGELVFVGMRLPLLAFAIAKRVHAPSAFGVFEAGIVRDEVPRAALHTMGDGANVAGAAWCTSLTNVMSLLGRGEVALGMIGGAEIDRRGNVNTSYIGRWEHPTVKLPGSGGGADIACLAQRTVVILAQERHRFVERVSYVTSPGRNLAQVVTTAGLLGMRDGELVLESVHPGRTVDEVRELCGWDLRVADDVGETPPPTAEELAALRTSDVQTAEP